LRPFNAKKGVNAKTKPNIAILTQPFLARPGKMHLDNMIAITRPLANRLFILTYGGYGDPPCGAEMIRISDKEQTRFFARVLGQVIVHIRFFRFLSKMRAEIDVLIFFLATAYPLPLVLARAAHIKCFIVLTGSGSATQLSAIRESGAQSKLGDLAMLYLLEAFQRISYHLAQKLIVYGPSIVDQAKLHKHRKKIAVAHRHFLNFDEYRFKNNIEQRDNIVGYIGRFSEEKGILNLAKAIPKILSTQKDVQFLLVGAGRLDGEIRACLEKHALQGNAKLTGFIPHDELPDYLIRLKLLVLPSYTEGLPNVMLEAMACGTPVLATAVGAIPDVLKDKETGFLMHDNTPSHLAEAIIQTLQNPHLSQIAINARRLVEREFQYETVALTWKNVICSAKDG
jgi:glycosyltransferase involved in cell wall biosynthesis